MAFDLNLHQLCIYYEDTVNFQENWLANQLFLQEERKEIQIKNKTLKKYQYPFQCRVVFHAPLPHVLQTASGTLSW